MPFQWSDNVKQTARGGLDNVGGQFNYQDVVTPSADHGAAGRHQAYFNYAGGARGFVVTTLTTITQTSAAVKDFIWGHLTQLVNYAAEGENTALYSQAIKKNGAGPTWGAVVEAIDDSNTGDKPSPLVALELDVSANGSDVNRNRLGLHIVARPYNNSGAPLEVAESIRLDASAPNTIVQTAMSLYAGSHFGQGIDLSPAALSSNIALRLAAGQRIAFDAGATVAMWYGDNVVQLAGASLALWKPLAFASAGNISASAAGGTAQALPAKPVTYLAVIIDGNPYKIPIYGN